MTDKTIDLSGTEPETLEFEPATFRDDVTVKLMDMMGDENSIVRRARVSVKGSNSLENVPGTELSKRDVGLLKRLYKDQHGVPFEGVEFEFYLEAPLFTIQQILKHRLSSINQVSGRYSKMEGTFYLPPVERPLVQIGKTMDYNFIDAEDWQREALLKIRKNANETWWHNYNALLHIGIAKEVARQDAPHNSYASLYYKTNLRSLLNFLKLRSAWEDSKKVESKDVREKALKAMYEALTEVLDNQEDEDITLDPEVVESRLEDSFDFLLGGQRVASHPQYEVVLIADRMAKIVEEKLPNVWASFVEAGYYNV